MGKRGSVTQVYVGMATRILGGVFGFVETNKLESPPPSATALTRILKSALNAPLHRYHPEGSSFLVLGCLGLLLAC